MVWVDNGDILIGTLGHVGTHSANSAVNYYATLTYTVIGDFTFKVWVEGELA